jgi:hypothetical protein
MFRLSHIVSTLAILVLVVAKPVSAQKPDDKPAFTYKLTKKEWKVGDKPVYLCDQNRGFGILTGFSGDFAGNGEFLQVRIDDKKKWLLHCQAFTGAMAGQAIMIENLSPKLFLPEHQVFEWLAGKDAVKMIAADQGICYISLIKGTFAGSGEKVQIEKRDDGFYWLTGQSQQQELGVQATAFKWQPGQGKKLKTETHRWQAGNDPVQIFPKSAGLCFVTSISGNLAGYGEALTLDVDAQGMWILSGRSQQESLQIEATGLRWDGK